MEEALNGENQLLVTNEPFEFKLQNNQLKIKTSEEKKILIIFIWIYGIYLKLIKKNQKITTCNQLDFEKQGFWPIMPKILPRRRKEEQKGQ